jgi:hypothetical protein
MHPTYQAALIAARTAFADLSAAVADLPDESLDWAPVAGTNSVNVLVRHSITATRFLASGGAGLGPDRQAYMAGDRAEAFKVLGATSAGLIAEIDAFLPELETILGAGNDAALAVVAPWAFADGITPTGAHLVIHTIGHLREHVGQVQLMRDLWLAAHPKA